MRSNNFGDKFTKGNKNKPYSLATKDNAGKFALPTTPRYDSRYGSLEINNDAGDNKNENLPHYKPETNEFDGFYTGNKKADFPKDSHEIGDDFDNRKGDYQKYNDGNSIE